MVVSVAHRGAKNLLEGIAAQVLVRKVLPKVVAGALATVLTEENLRR